MNVPTGATGPIAAILPFSISKYGTTLGTDAAGRPQYISFSGFSPGYTSSTYLQEGEWDTGNIVVRSDINYPTSFIMTITSILRRIHVLFALNESTTFDAGVTLTPFICLAISTGNNLVFEILPATMTFAEAYEGGITYPEYTAKRGERNDLAVTIPQGALVAIIAGIMGQDVSTEQVATFSASGGLYLE